MQLKSEGYGTSKFAKVFGDESMVIAKRLLQGALETETASDVKLEIERRLRLLEPKQTVKIKCNRCGRLFQPRRVRRFHQNFCEECMKKRFGNRT
jgi:formylmethanofuran dehydrogenase subunit E